MERNIEQAFKNTIIAFKLMSYSYSLLDFFKDEFKKDNGYMIPFSHILDFKKRVFPLIRDSCGYVCPKLNHATGTIFLMFLKKFINSNKMSFSRENVIFEIFISLTSVSKEMKFTKWKRFAVLTFFRKFQKIYHI